LSQSFSRWFPLSPKGLGLLALAAVAGWLAAQPLWEYRRLTQLRDHGATALAHITSTRIDASGRFAVDIIDYDFQPGGVGPLYTGEERISSDEREGADPSKLYRESSQGVLTVRFVSEDPSINRLDVWFPERIHHNGWWGFLCLAACAVLLMCGLFLLMREVQWRRSLADDSRMKRKSGKRIGHRSASHGHHREETTDKDSGN
jgi:hypothetical protein